MSRIAFLSVALLTCLLWPSGADARGSENTWVRATALAPSCTLDVVLVTFQDETETTAGEDCHYCNHDRPYGTNSGESADSSYTLRDFERLFSGGYGNLAPLVGDTVTVASHTTLPEVYGSVRAYYDSMSLDPRDRAQGVRSGKFQLHVRLINAENGDYPRWIELRAPRLTMRGLTGMIHVGVTCSGTKPMPRRGTRCAAGTRTKSRTWRTLRTAGIRCPGTP